MKGHQSSTSMTAQLYRRRVATRGGPLHNRSAQSRLGATMELEGVDGDRVSSKLGNSVVS